MLPSDYYRRQCWNTFQVDRFAIEIRAGLEDKFIWSSDFPHAGADWPNSVKTIEKNLIGVPLGEQKMILTDEIAGAPLASMAAEVHAVGSERCAPPAVSIR